jgi:hypothetical protein
LEVGYVIKEVYPPTVTYPNEDQIVQCCFPDGCHDFEEEWTCLNIKHSTLISLRKGSTRQLVENGSKRDLMADNSGSPRPLARRLRQPTLKQQQPQDDFLYGLSFYRNFKSATAKRGAVQKALFIVSRQPYFDLFVRILREAMQLCISVNESSQKSYLEVLKTVS